MGISAPHDMSLRPQQVHCQPCNGDHNPPNPQNELGTRLKQVLTLGKTRLQTPPVDTGRQYADLAALAADKAMLMRRNEERPGVPIVKPRTNVDLLIDECSLCLEPLIDSGGFNPGSYHLEVLSDTAAGCGHIFHRDCLYQHITSRIRSSGLCPLCKTPIPQIVTRAAHGLVISPAQTATAVSTRITRMRFTFALDVLAAYDNANPSPSLDELLLIVNDKQLEYGYGPEGKRQAMPENYESMDFPVLVSRLRQYVEDPTSIPKTLYPVVVVPIAAAAPNIPRAPNNLPPELPPPGPANGYLYEDSEETTQGKFVATAYTDAQMQALAFNEKRSDQGPYTDPMARKRFYLTLGTRQLLFEAMHNRMSQVRMSIDPARRIVPVSNYYPNILKKLLFSSNSLAMFSDDAFWRLMPDAENAVRLNAVPEDGETISQLQAFNENFLTPLLYDIYKTSHSRFSKYITSGEFDEASLERDARVHSTNARVLTNHRAPLLTGLRLLAKPLVTEIKSLRFDTAELANSALRDKLASIASMQLFGKYSRRRAALSEGTTRLRN